MLKKLLITTAFISYAAASSDVVLDDIDKRIEIFSTELADEPIHVHDNVSYPDVSFSKAALIINTIFQETSVHQIYVPESTIELQQCYLDLFLHSYTDFTSTRLCEIITRMVRDGMYNPNKYHLEQTKELNFIWECALKGVVIKKFSKKYVCPTFHKIIAHSLENEDQHVEGFYADIHYDGQIYYSHMEMMEVPVRRHVSFSDDK